MPKRLAILTELDKEQDGYFRLLRSCQSVGWNLFSFFHQTPPHLDLAPQDRANWFISNKHEFIYNDLSELRDEGYQHFLYLDAFDTVLIRYLHGLEDMFDSALTFAGEKNCYPEPRYAEFFTEGTFPYLNTGVIWGEIEAYLDLCPRGEVHDQLAWTRVALQHQEIVIDNEATFALCLHSTSPGDWAKRGDIWEYTPTATVPKVLHANGNWGMPAWVEEAIR